MKLLILGRQGQIATHLRELAPDAVCWGRSDLDLGANAADIEARILAAAPDAIINAAAYTAVDRAESERAQAWALNAAAPAAIARAAEHLGVPLIHFSTEYVFDGRQQAPYAPDAPVAPLGVYGATKLAGELAVANLCRTGWILRCSWVFSEHGSNFVKTMLRLGAERDALTVVADQTGRPTYAGDLASLALKLAIAAARNEFSLPAGLYHLGSGPDTTWHDFAKLIFEEACAHGLMERLPDVRAISTAEYPTPAKRPLAAVLAPSRNLQAALGELPDWRSGLARTISELSRQL
ncbi:MAG: dTDP-4-dehydrorhamnose reductase [Gammaproteobacteria bacterium]|nr:dTDP-4-dehydrorhamnose reductase [Gammaproteobacteria bacterium]